MKTPAVFGAELTKLLADTGDEGETPVITFTVWTYHFSFLVPQVLRICTQFIEEFGIINGIYRASGISSNIQRIKLVLVVQYLIISITNCDFSPIIFVSLRTQEIYINYNPFREMFNFVLQESF